MSASFIKSAAVTTVTVLAFVYVLNQFAVTKPLVQRAIMG